MLSITPDSLKIAIALVIVLAGLVERFIEILKPALVFIKNPDILVSVKVALAILVGFGVAALLHSDLLALLGIAGLPPVLGYLVAGIMASFGASFWHPILEWLKTIKRTNPERTDPV